MDQNNNMNIPARENRSSGALIAAIVILVIIVGALYFWGHRAGIGGDDALEAITTQDSSDEAAAIEADLNSTDVNNVDSGLDESEFNAS